MERSRIAGAGSQSADESLARHGHHLDEDLAAGLAHGADPDGLFQQHMQLFHGIRVAVAIGYRTQLFGSRIATDAPILCR